VGLGLEDPQREHFDVLSLPPVIDEIRHQIEDGRGFVVVRRLPVEDYSKDEIGMIFWVIGTYLGRGLSQSVLGDRLGHVKDFSHEDPLARAYRNEQELSTTTRSCTRGPRSTTATPRGTGGVICCVSGSKYRRCGPSTRTSRAAASRRCPVASPPTTGAS
jgi:hypothetical protein